ncbi:ABC transporter substrate-binding protein [Candidatus Roizmanbacteria bacterium]|nr:ABC transporter substrate-binding protein [Candidatus Roizmanbacteria bacterium]
MLFEKKTYRYYYWLVLEFVKKHIKLILISFLLSFFFLIAAISLSPYLDNFISTKNEVIGMIGNYDYNNLSDDVLNKISNGLIVINEKGQIVPALASSWELRDQGRRYRFHLKDNLFWDDGKKFTAYDIKYQFVDVEVKTIDDKTIDFSLKKILPIFPTYLKKQVIRYPLIGVAGLYKVDRTKTHFGNIAEINLAPNKKDQPTITYKFYDNETQLLTAYKRGEISEFTTAKKSIADGFSAWKNTTISKTTDYSTLLTLFFNFNNPALKEKEIRQAINMSMNPDQLKEFGEIALGPIPPVSFAYNPDLKPATYDPAAAEKIIKKSTGSSESAKLNFTTYYDYLASADLVVGLLKRIGLNVDVKVVSFDRGNDYDFLLAFWKVPFDPDQYYFWHSTQNQRNISNYKNVKIDKLLEDGRSSLDPQDRKKIYFEYQRVMQDDPPASFLYFPFVYNIKRK